MDAISGSEPFGETARPEGAPDSASSLDPETAGEELGDAGGDARGSPERPATPTASIVDALARRASGIVEQAASILEEEVAAGIVAARQAESRYLGASKLHSPETHQLLQRFRKDAHEVVDLLIDLVGVSASMLGNLARNAISLGGGLPDAANATAAPGAGTIPLLTLPRVLAPGEIGDLSLTIENDLDKSTGLCGFLTTGLVSAAGHRIPAESVRFEPPELAVAAHSVGSVSVSVQVPEDSAPGEYAGLIQSPAWPQARAALTVHVGPARAR